MNGVPLVLPDLNILRSTLQQDRHQMPGINIENFDILSAFGSKYPLQPRQGDPGSSFSVFFESFPWSGFQFLDLFFEKFIRLGSVRKFLLSESVVPPFGPSICHFCVLNVKKYGHQSHHIPIELPSAGGSAFIFFFARNAVGLILCQTFLHLPVHIDVQACHL